MPSFWEDPLGFIASWLESLLLGWGLAEGFVHFLLIFLGAVILPLTAMLFVIFLIWYERKLYGRIQDRLGPNRVGPFGLFQTFADMGKIFTKELITPIGVDKVPYNLAPILAVAAVLLVWAVIPLAPGMVGADLAVGLLFAIAVGSFGELSIMLAGWGSNNKYALLAGFRAVALLVSYEIPLVIVLMIPAMLSGSLRLIDIVEGQSVPYIIFAPAAAIIFFITLVAESGRAPFDITEAESEIVAGFNIEYSGLKFGMFYVAEFLHAFTVSMLFATIFLGGYKGPFVDQVALLGPVYLFAKTFVIYFVTILFRGALPRFRMDQMLNLNWKILTPLAISLVFVTALVDKLVVQLGGQLLIRSLVLLLVNLGVLWLTSRLMTRLIRTDREVVTGPRPLATAEGASTGPR